MTDVDSWIADTEKEAAEKENESAEVVHLRTLMPYKGKARIIVPDAAPFEFVAVGDLEYSEPEYLADKFIETDSLAMFFADPNCGKTIVAIDLSCCVASGKPFHGREVQQGAVFYIAGEGHNGLARRFNGWAKHNDVDLKSVPLFTSKRTANFLDAAHAAAVATAVDSLSAVHGMPRLIVVDTLARSFGGGDENSTQDMNAFINAMDDLRARYPGSTILIVHHTGHAEKTRARGAMSLLGALDASYCVTKADDTITITCTKMKEAEFPAPMSFTLKGVPLGVDGKGREFGSAVLVPCDTPVKGARLTKPQERGLRTFRVAADKYGAKHDDGGMGVKREDWKKAFAADYEGEPSGVNSAFSQAIKALKPKFINQNGSLFQLTYAGGAGE